MGPFYHLVLSNLGWKIMLRILCGFAFLMFVSALFYRPLPAKYKRAHIGRKERAKLFDLSVWKIKPFVFWVVAMWLIHIGYFVPFIYLVSKRLFKNFTFFQTWGETSSLPCESFCSLSPRWIWSRDMQEARIGFALRFSSYYAFLCPFFR